MRGLGGWTFRGGGKPAKVIYDPRIVSDIEAWLVKRLGPLAEIEIVAVIIPPAEEVPTAPGEEPVESMMDNSAEYTGGIMPEEMRLEFRDAYQEGGLTQAQVAEMLGLSRPHLANALLSVAQ